MKKNNEHKFQHYEDIQPGIFERLADYKYLIAIIIFVIGIVTGIFVYTEYIDVVNLKYTGNVKIKNEVANQYGEMVSDLNNFGYIENCDIDSCIISSRVGQGINTVIYDDKTAKLILKGYKEYPLCLNKECSFKLIKIFDDNNIATEMLLIERSNDKSND